MFCFHGAFAKKSKAVEKERKTPGAFIKGIHYGIGDYRHAVLTRREPSAANPLLSPAEKRLLRMKAKRGIKRGIRKLLGFGERPPKGKPRSRSKPRTSGKVTAIRPAASSRVRDDVISALINQGYNRKQAEQMTPAAQGGDTITSLFKRAMARRNPDLSPEDRAAFKKAREFFKGFHGTEPKKVIRMEATIVEAGDYAMVGKLYGFDMSAMPIRKFSDMKPNMQVKADAGIMLCGANIERVPAEDLDYVPPWVVPDQQGKVLVAHQLMVLGGNQNLEPVLESVFGITSGAQFLDLGEITNVWYIAKKKQNNFQLTHWHHTFGEEEATPAAKRAARPYLMYDRENHKLFIVGGEYSVPLEGIRN